jgi:SOUL heme-binding protein
MLGWIASLATQLVEAGGSVVGVRTGTEEPGFVLQQRLNGLEIRRYDARIAAQTTVDADEERARSQGFRRLAGYIFGRNNGNAKIAMTAPVGQQRGPSASGQRIAMTAPVSAEAGRDGAWVIQFFMPAEWTLETLPEPKDKSVELVTVPSQTFAVLRFTGSRSPAAVASRTEELLSTLIDTEFEPTGSPRAWFYDPPWTLPFCRRNEVAVPVTKR